MSPRSLAIAELPPFTEFLQPAFWQDPYVAFSKAYADPFPLHQLAGEGLVVLGYEASAAIVRDERFGVASSEENLGALGASDSLVKFFSYALLNINEPEHRERKIIIGRRLGKKRVSELASLVEATASRLVAELLDAREGDFLTLTAGPFARRTFCGLLQIPAEDEALLEQWSRDLAVGLKVLPTAEDNALGAIAADQFLAYLTELGERRLAEPGDDLLSIALEGFGGEYSLRLAVGTVAQVIFDGIDTVKHALGNGLHTLLLHPGAWKELSEDASVLPEAIEEMLRYQTSAFLTGRKALEDVELQGVEIPAGTQLVMMWPAANRDPRRFERPDVFDIRRPDNRHFSFGGGAHFCAGAGLARIQMRQFFEAFFSRAARIELLRDDLRWTEFQFTRGLTELPIRVSPR